MCHGDEAHLLAYFLLALDRLAVLRHVRNLAEETGRAGLATGVRVDLGVDDEHLDRFARHHRAGEVLETDVVHRAVAADGDHGRTEIEFLVREIVPAEVAERLLVSLRVVLVLQQAFGKPDRLEAVRHLRHVPFEYAHGHRGGILEQVIRPGERIRIERISAAPDGGATGGVQYAHAGAALARRADLVPLLEILELRDQIRCVLQPLAIDGFGFMRPLHALGDPCKGEIALVGLFEHRLHFFRVAKVDLTDQLHLHVLFQFRNEFVDMRDMLCDARLDQRLHGCNEQVDDGLFRTTETGPVAAGERQVHVFVEEDRFECADAFLEIVDPDVLVRRVRQVKPEVPVLAQRFYAVFCLLDRAQGVILADFDAFHAAFAGIRIDRDTQQSAAARLFFLGHGEIRPA